MKDTIPKIMFDPSKLKLVDPNELKVDPKNRNKHSDAQIERFCLLLDTYGMRWPILVSEQTGYIKAGEGRLLAAKKRNMPQVLVSYQEFSSHEVEYGFGISDNAIAAWAELDLSGINADMSDMSGFDIDLLGIKDFKITEVEKVPGCDEDDVPVVPPIEALVKLGDIWVLGSHRLMCGDSTSIDAVEKLMNGQKADMVFTDPPYGMNLDTDYSGLQGSRKSKLERAHKSYPRVIGDEKDFEFLDFYALVESVEEHFWWGADWYCNKIPLGGSWFVWDRTAGNDQLQKMVGSSFELCWSKKRHKRDIASVTWKGVLGHSKKDDGDNKSHPTMKPIKLIEWFFGRFKGEKVIDLFGGSGSTLIACEKTNRKCFMMELDPHYCTVIIKRWEKYSGQKALRLDGET